MNKQVRLLNCMPPDRIWLKEEASQKVTWRLSGDGVTDVEYVRADIAAQTQERLSELQSQLAQVVQERDEYRERLLKATETEVEI